MIKACVDCRYSRKERLSKALLCVHLETFHYHPVDGKKETFCYWLRVKHTGKTSEGFCINQLCSGDLWESAMAEIQL